jgi:hypothetical protein
MVCAASSSSSVSCLQKVVVNPPNARRTMEALREMGYDSYASILDLIDNSIDAHGSVISVTIEERKGDIVVTVADDGVGMDLDTLSEALRLGSDIARDPGELGKFGMGLVTASIGLSQHVEVVTKEAEGEMFYGSFDLEKIGAKNQFLKVVGTATKEQAALLPYDKGTVVVLSKTDRISNRHPTTFANTLRKRVGQVFRKFLKAGLKIEVNGDPAEAFDPLMLSHPQTYLALETDIEVDHLGKAALRVVDLPDLGQAGNASHGIIPQNSGFYVVRNNREIMESQTFDFYKKHPDFSHFRAELCFDGSLDSAFHTDVKKMSIQLSQSFLDKLRQATYGLIRESGRMGRARANTTMGQVDHSVAETNIVRRGTLIPKPKALVEKRVTRGTKGAHPKGEGDRDRTPRHTTLRTIAGLRVVFEEGDYGEDSHFYQVRQSGRTITVTYNREHPFWRELVEHAESPKVIAILDYLVFAMANAELMVPEPAQIVKQQVNATLVGLLV